MPFPHIVILLQDPLNNAGANLSTIRNFSVFESVFESAARAPKGPRRPSGDRAVCKAGQDTGNKGGIANAPHADFAGWVLTLPLTKGNGVPSGLLYFSIGDPAAS